jgi:hypothetical protein
LKMHHARGEAFVVAMQMKQGERAHIAPDPLVSQAAAGQANCPRRPLPGRVVALPGTDAS